MWKCVLAAIMSVIVCNGAGKLRTEEDTDNSANNDLTDVDSTERVGAVVTKVIHHPYSASLLQNNNYLCSSVILNTYWLVTSSKCFDADMISSYVTYIKLENYTMRVGSSYNNKEGSIFKIKMLINNFDVHVSGVKLQDPLTFGSRVSAVRLPQVEDDVTLGYLASIVAWTPTGHIRLVNVPIMEASLCDPYTKMATGLYICVGGVQDPNRHFCRKDNGGAVIQNDTLVAIATFHHSCADYNKVHAFPKVASFTMWLDSVIWDEESRPTAITNPTTTVMTNATERTESQTLFADPRKFLLTLPFEPIDVPLEPAGDNSVMPRMSLYESYLQNLARVKTSTTRSPKQLALRKAWMEKFGPTMFMGKYEGYDDN